MDSPRNNNEAVVSASVGKPVLDTSKRAASSGPGFQAWLVVGFLWFVALLNYLDRLMITTMRDPIKQSIPMNDAEFGLLTSVFLWVYGLLSPFGGYLADRLGRSRVILGSLAVWSVVTWLTGHAQTFRQLLVARGLMGISEACYIPAAFALIADYHRGSTRSLATGLHTSGIYVGAALGGMGGVISEHYGWRIAFTAFGIMGLLYAAILLFFLRDSSSNGRDDRVPSTNPLELNIARAISALFTQKGFLMLFALNAIVGIANWGIYGWLPTYLKEHFNLGLGAAGMSATGYIQVASFAGVLIGGIWADRWSRRNPRARALVPGMGFCVLAPCLYMSASTNVFSVAILGLLVFGLGRGFFDSNHMPILRQLVDGRYSATGYGFLNFTSCIAGGVMIFVGGAMKDASISLSKVFQFSAAGLFVAGLILISLKLRRNESSS